MKERGRERKEEKEGEWRDVWIWMYGFHSFYLANAYSSFSVHPKWHLFLGTISRVSFKQVATSHKTTTHLTMQVCGGMKTSPGVWDECLASCSATDSQGTPSKSLHLLGLSFSIYTTKVVDLMASSLNIFIPWKETLGAEWSSSALASHLSNTCLFSPHPPLSMCSWRTPRTQGLCTHHESSSAFEVESEERKESGGNSQYFGKLIILSPFV